MRLLSGCGWVRGSDSAVLSRLRDEAVVHPGFLSQEEEDTLTRELEPQLRRRRYEYDHWDSAIHGFRETEKSCWSDASQAILQRVRAAAFGPDQTLLSLVHVLDLEHRGYIKPHVDSVKVGRSRRQSLRTPSQVVGGQRGRTEPDPTYTPYPFPSSVDLPSLAFLCCLQVL